MNAQSSGASHAEATSLNPHVREIDARISARHLLAHPFYTALAGGTLPRPALERYARQYYRHVEVFPRYISAIHANCDDLAIRQELLENLVEEERGEEHHPELWLRFTDALGLAREDVTGATLVPETIAMVDGMLEIARQGSVAEGLASLYAYEAQIPELAQCELDALRTHYGVTDAAALKFFTVHMDADIVHRQVGRDILSALVTDANAPLVLAAVDRTLAALAAFAMAMHEFPVK